MVRSPLRNSVVGRLDGTRDLRQTRDMELIGQAFRVLDTDGSGWLEEDELRQALNMLGMPGWSTRESARIIESMDKNKDGNVDFDEFYQHAMSTEGANRNDLHTPPGLSNFAAL